MPRPRTPGSTPGVGAERILPPLDGELAGVGGVEDPPTRTDHLRTDPVAFSHWNLVHECQRVWAAD